MARLAAVVTALLLIGLGSALVSLGAATLPRSPNVERSIPALDPQIKITSQPGGTE